MESNIIRLVEHVVGKSEHIHAKSNLMLKTRCSAKLSSPHAAIFPFSTLFEKLETLVSSGALVTGSNKLQISAHFVMEDFRAQDLDTAAFIQGLATVFCGAEMWRQLGLKACQVIPPSNQNFPYQFKDLCFSLRHLAPSLNSFHEFDGEQSLTSHDIVQPPGIPSVLLEHIQIDFSFSYLRSCSNGKRNKIECFDEVDIPMLLRDYMASQVGPADVSRPLLCKEAALSTPNQYQRSGLLPTLGIDSTQDQEMVMSNCLLGFSSQVLAEELHFGRPFVKRPAAEYMEKETKIAFADLAKLVDAGLRTMLCGEKIDLLNGVTLLTGHSGPILAEISPALFKPAYLSAVLDRSQYVDTIANTTSAIHGNCYSPSLRSKIEALENFSPEEYVENELDWIQQTPKDRLLNAVKVRLWKLILSGLLCPPGNTKIKPLYWTETSFSREPEDQDSLEEGTRIFPNNGHDIYTKTNEDLLFEHHSLASKNVDSDLLESDLFDFENASLDDKSFFYGEDEMLDLALQDDYGDEDLFWEDRYWAEPSPTNNRRDTAFNFENIVLLADDDENLLLDGSEITTSNTHEQHNARSIPSMDHEGCDDELLLIEI